MKRGISFEIPNEYGNFLEEIFKPIDLTKFSWKIGSCESYIVVKDTLDKELFPEDKKEIKGTDLKNLLKNNIYIISADLQAYSKGKIKEIKTYKEFIESDCSLVLLVVDSSYTTIYCKDKIMLELLYRNAEICGFNNVLYITEENDTRTRLSVW